MSCKLQCVFEAVLCVDPALTVYIGIGKLFGNPHGEGMEGLSRYKALIETKTSSN